jgi:hypothetical protein
MDLQLKDGKVFVDGVEYAPVSSVPVNAEGLKYCIVRTNSAGVFSAFVKSLDGDKAELIESRRLWYWDGAASLSQLSQDGVSKPENCKFPQIMPEQTVLGVIEVIPCSDKAKKSIEGVKTWTK